VTYASTARPDESVVSLSEMLGTRGVAVSSRVGRAPNTRTGLTAGELLLREGYQGLSIGVADGPRHYRPDAIVRAREPEEVAAAVEPTESPARSAARMRLATATGAVVALGSLVGASTMNSGSSHAPVSAMVHELGNVYAGYGVLSGPGETSAVTRHRPQSRSAVGSLAPLRDSASADNSGVPGLITRRAHPEQVSDVRPDSRSHVLAAPDARQAAERSQPLVTQEPGRPEASNKKRWPFSRSTAGKKNDPAAAASGRTAKPDNTATLGKANRSNKSSDSGKATKLDKSTSSSKSGSAASRPGKSSKSERSGSSRRSSSEGGGSSGKHSSSSGKSGSHKSGGSHGGGHSSGKSGGHKG
jgi:hypothetical protein